MIINLILKIILELLFCFLMYYIIILFIIKGVKKIIKQFKNYKTNKKNNVVPTNNMHYKNYTQGYNEYIPTTNNKTQNEITKNKYNENYRKKTNILTPTELKFYKTLKPITDKMELLICPQVILYEILETKQNNDIKYFNKISNKSIDFVITDRNMEIKMCIELDDYTHKKNSRIERDNFINDLFKDVNIKLLRIPVAYNYNEVELAQQIKESLY